MNPLIGHRRRRWMFLEGFLLLSVLAALIWLGTVARKQVWQRTEALRYKPDMDNAWTWGSRAAREGYFSLYDRVVAEKPENKYDLDYAPLRLAVMTLWAKSRLAEEPTPTKWDNSYAFNAPLLHFNTAMELLAGAAIFVLAREWSRRDEIRQDRSRRWLRAEWLATAAFALFWFNPAVLLSAHARPTWDIWILPFYLWAIWCCGRNFWFIAGCIIAVGACFKAQQLMAVPIFFLWPLMRFRIGAILRFVVGFALSAGLIVSPWIVGLHFWPIEFVLSVTLLFPTIWLALWRWPIRGWHPPARWLRWVVPFFSASALALCVPLFGGSINWFRVSVIYGAKKFNDLEVGGASSLAGILKKSYQWNADSLVESLQWTGWPITISNVLIACYALLLIPCCWAMHRYARAGDRRFVMAMAAPWIIYFAIFPKMHERYLLWGAMAACASTIVGMGPVWLALLLSALSSIMSIFQMLSADHAGQFLTEISPTAGKTLHDLIEPTFPGIGWAVLLAMAVWIWITVAGAFCLPWRRPRTQLHLEK